MKHAVIILILSLPIFLVQSCKKEDIPKPIIFNPNILYNTISDVDGNIYKTVQIGNQTWMAENLKTTKFKDNTFIPLVTDELVWPYLSTPEYCWYNNDPATYKASYGALYNWYTINTSKLCPTGWHVPSDSEWTILTNYVENIIDDNNENNMVCNRLKETGTAHWNNSSNINATNESGFTALPGGVREGDVWQELNDGKFISLGSDGHWWSSTENSADNSSDNAWYRYISNDYCGHYRGSYPKTGGMSVRCIKDN